MEYNYIVLRSINFTQILLNNSKAFGTLLLFIQPLYELIYILELTFRLPISAATDCNIVINKILANLALNH